MIALHHKHHLGEFSNTDSSPVRLHGTLPCASERYGCTLPSLHPLGARLHQASCPAEALGRRRITPPCATSSQMLPRQGVATSAPITRLLTLQSPSKHMNDTPPSPPSLPPVKDPADNKRKWVTLQVSLTRELYEQIKQQLNEFSVQTGFDYSASRFAAHTLQNHWKVELEHARKSFGKYHRHV